MPNSNKTPETVYLVEILNGGHREAFMQLFARSLLDLGKRVVCIMPDTTVVEAWIKANCPGQANRCSFYQVSFPKHLQGATGKWENLVAYSRIWYYYRNHLRRIESRSGYPAEFVFFNCIDGHLSNYLPAPLIDLVFPYTWSGLYFHPNHLRTHAGIFERVSGISDVDHPLLARRCIAVAIHDEGVVEGFSKRLKGKPVLLFPEIADITPPDPDNAIARAISEKAKGRTVVGMIGLEPHKGSYEFMRLAKTADPSRYFFAFCGSFSEDWYDRFLDPQHAAEFREFIRDLPENCYWNTGFLKEGAEYNAVFHSFDIIFLVYRNFYSSSNRLTKAANFHKLVLSGDKYCVGEDVLRYDLGATVTDTQPETLQAALEKLRDRLQRDDLPYANWKVYADKHGEAILAEKFRELLKYCR